MIPANWTLNEYEAGNVGGWAGWYTDEGGDTRAYVGVDGDLLLVENIQ